MTMNSKPVPKTMQTLRFSFSFFFFFIIIFLKYFLGFACVISSEYGRPFEDICVTSILWWFVCDLCTKHRMLSTHTMLLNISTLRFQWFWEMGRLFIFISLDLVSVVSCAFVFCSNVILNSFYGFSKAILFIWRSVFSQHLAIGMTFFYICFVWGLNKQFITLRGNLKSFFCSPHTHAHNGFDK